MYLLQSKLDYDNTIAGSALHQLTQSSTVQYHDKGTCPTLQYHSVTELVRMWLLLTGNEVLMTQ